MRGMALLHVLRYPRRARWAGWPAKQSRHRSPDHSAACHLSSPTTCCQDACRHRRAESPRMSRPAHRGCAHAPCVRRRHLVPACPRCASRPIRQGLADHRRPARALGPRVLVRPAAAQGRAESSAMSSSPFLAVRSKLKLDDSGARPQVRRRCLPGFPKGLPSGPPALTSERSRFIARAAGSRSSACGPASSQVFLRALLGSAYSPDRGEPVRRVYQFAPVLPRSASVDTPVAAEFRLSPRTLRRVDREGKTRSVRGSPCRPGTSSATAGSRSTAPTSSAWCLHRPALAADTSASARNRPPRRGRRGRGDHLQRRLDNAAGDRDADRWAKAPRVAAAAQRRSCG